MPLPTPENEAIKLLISDPRFQAALRKYDHLVGIPVGVVTTNNQPATDKTTGTSPTGRAASPEPLPHSTKPNPALQALYNDYRDAKQKRAEREAAEKLAHIDYGKIEARLLSHYMDGLKGNPWTMPIGPGSFIDIETFDPKWHLVELKTVPTLCPEFPYMPHDLAMEDGEMTPLEDVICRLEHAIKATDHHIKNLNDAAEDPQSGVRPSLAAAEAGVRDAERAFDEARDALRDAKQYRGEAKHKVDMANAEIDRVMDRQELFDSALRVIGDLLKEVEEAKSKSSNLLAASAIPEVIQVRIDRVPNETALTTLHRLDAAILKASGVNPDEVAVHRKEVLAAATNGAFLYVKSWDDSTDMTAYVPFERRLYHATIKVVPMEHVINVKCLPTDRFSGVLHKIDTAIAKDVKLTDSNDDKARMQNLKAAVNAAFLWSHNPEDIRKGITGTVEFEGKKYVVNVLVERPDSIKITIARSECRTHGVLSEVDYQIGAALGYFDGTRWTSSGKSTAIVKAVNEAFSGKTGILHNCDVDDTTTLTFEGKTFEITLRD